jgi:hypothetical protein
MQTKSFYLEVTKCSAILSLFIFFLACDKSAPDDGVNVSPYYNLDVTLSSAASKQGHGDRVAGFIKFRQDPDTARIITLDTWVFHLQPNHAYQLQRAVDPIATADCLSTAWLTLGAGLVPQSIQTDGKGNGTANLFRNVTAVARGTQFRIHFQVIDAVTLETVLTSDCYQYTVR